MVNSVLNLPKTALNFKEREHSDPQLFCIRRVDAFGLVRIAAVQPTFFCYAKETARTGQYNRKSPATLSFAGLYLHLPDCYFTMIIFLI